MMDMLPNIFNLFMLIAMLIIPPVLLYFIIKIAVANVIRETLKSTANGSANEALKYTIKNAVAEALKETKKPEDSTHDYTA